MRIIVTKMDGKCIRTSILAHLVPYLVLSNGFSLVERFNSSTRDYSDTAKPLVYRDDLPGGTRDYAGSSIRVYPKATIRGFARPHLDVVRGVFEGLFVDVNQDLLGHLKKLSTSSIDSSCGDEVLLLPRIITALFLVACLIKDIHSRHAPRVEILGYMMPLNYTVLTSILNIQVLMTTTLAFTLVPFPDGGLYECTGRPFVDMSPSTSVLTSVLHPCNRIILGCLAPCLYVSL